MALTADTATIETLSGTHQTYRRRRSIAYGEAALPWELGPLGSGKDDGARFFAPIAVGVSCRAIPYSMPPSMVTCSAPIASASTWNFSRGAIH